MDVKKLATIPPGGGGRCTGGERSPDREWATRSRASVVDDHSRLAYSEPLPDEKAPTVVAFTIRALRFYRQYGITRTRALPDRLHHYHNHRPHTNLGGKPPTARLVTT